MMREAGYMAKHVYASLPLSAKSATAPLPLRSRTANAQRHMVIRQRIKEATVVVAPQMLMVCYSMAPSIYAMPQYEPRVAAAA